MGHVGGALTGISFREAERSDVDGLMDVQRRSPGRSSTEKFREYVVRALDDPSLLIVVAETGNEVVGWAMTTFFPEPDGAAPAGHYLMGVTVVPESRRKGIGLELVRARLEWISQRDSHAYYFTNVRNIASVAMHERHGFREIARGPQFRDVPFDGGCGLLMGTDLA
jgi:aminoglycoside 6'-N-acetyltransferase I